MALSKKSSKSKKSGPNNSQTLKSDFEVGDLDGNVEVGLIGGEISINILSDENTQIDIIAGIDLSPASIDIEVDANTNEISTSLEIGLPGDLVGITGGLTIDADTGEITAIEGGVAVAGLEMKIETGVGKYACRTTTTFTLFGVGYSITEDNCSYEDEDKDEDENEENNNNQVGDENNPRVIINTDGSKTIAKTPGALLAWGINSNITTMIYQGNEWRFKPWCLNYQVTPGSRCPEKVFTGDVTRSPYIWLYQYGPGTSQPFYIGHGATTFGSTVSLTVWEYVPGTPTNEILSPILQVSVSNSIPLGTDCGPSPPGGPYLMPQYAHNSCAVWAPPPPSPTPTSRPRPRFFPGPYKQKEKNPMAEDCCLASLALLIKIANVIGLSEEYQYPQVINEDKELIANHLLEYIIKTNFTRVIGVSEVDKYPKKILIQPTVTSEDMKEVEVFNIVEELELIAGSTGYAKNKYPIVFRLENDKRKFTYNSNGEIVTDLIKVFACHKILYGNDNNGYAIPNKQLFPGGEGYDVTKDYLGVLTRLFSAVERYGFDAPISIKIKDANPAIKGDQPVHEDYKNLAGVMEKILYSHFELRSDLDAATNILVRLGYLATRTHQVLVRTFYRVTAILDGLKIPTRNERIEMKVEFDPSAGIEVKGFDKTDGNGEVIGTEERLDLHDDDTTEKLLPKFLRITSIPQVITKYIGSKKEK